MKCYLFSFLELFLHCFPPASIGERTKDNYDDEYIRIKEAVRSVTQPLDNAALPSLSKRSQLIGQAVQEDR